MRRQVAFFLIPVLLFTAAVSHAQDRTESNRQAFLTVISAGFNKGDLAAVEAILSPNYVQHTATGDGNKDTLLGTIAAMRAAIPDLVVTPDIVLADGDLVAGRATFAGTFTQPFQAPTGTISPTGKPILLTTDTMYRFDETGHAVEEWLALNNLDLLMQLGVIPAPPSSGPAPTVNQSASPEKASADVIAAHEAALLKAAKDAVTGAHGDLFDEMLASEYGLHSPLGEMNRDALKAVFQGLHAAMPDLTMTRQQLLSEGSLSGALTVVTGTFTEPYASPVGTLPPTGKPVTLMIVNFFRFNEAGQIVEEWAEFDNLAFLTQIGAVGAPNATPQVTGEATAGA